MVVARGIRGVEGISIDYITKTLFYVDNILGVIGAVRLVSPGYKDQRNLIGNLGNPRAIVVEPSIG